MQIRIHCFETVYVLVLLSYHIVKHLKNGPLYIAFIIVLNININQDLLAMNDRIVIYAPLDCYKILNKR